MRAAVLERFGEPLAVREVPEPEAGPGEVVVDVLATCVLPYTAEVFDDTRRYPLELPVIPGLGGVGRVVSHGPDATTLQVGDVVWCDPTVRSRDGGPTPDITLQGWSSRGDGGLRLARHFHDGPFAERMVLPTENVVPIGDPTPDEVARWSAIGIPLVPYGGLHAVGLMAGETLLVSGATGNFGSAAVAVGLAMGAGAVIATGRNAARLEELQRRFGDRVHPVVLDGDPDRDTRAIHAAAPAPIDVVLDLLPPAAGTAQVRTAAMTVRKQGRVVLMGGVGMLGGDDLALPYPWVMRNSITVRGQWMSSPVALTRFVALVRSGVYDLRQDRVTTFALDDVGRAVAHAAEHGGPFDRTVVLPRG